MAEMVYAEQRRHDEAITKCQKVVEINPNDAEAHNNLGFARYHRAKYDQAIESFK